MNFSCRPFCQSSSLSVSMTPPGAEPALLTKMSMRPKCLCAPSTKSLAPASRVRSAAMANTLRPPAPRISSAARSSTSLRRAQIATSQPSRASATAIPLPMPSLPPVTQAILPFSCRSIATSSSVGRCYIARTTRRLALSQHPLAKTSWSNSTFRIASVALRLLEPVCMRPGQSPLIDERPAAPRMTRRGLLLTMTEPPPAMEEEFNAWDDSEHLAERLAITGFRSARRWVANSGVANSGIANCAPGDGRYLATYELDSPDVLQSAEYLARFEAATPWTRRCLSKAVVFRRWACEQWEPGWADPHPLAKAVL